MNWIRLSERKPGLALTNVLYASNSDLLGFYSNPPIGATHWMVINPPENFVGKPVDPDWEQLERCYSNWKSGHNDSFSEDIYEFLKAKYDCTD